MRTSRTSLLAVVAASFVACGGQLQGGDAGDSGGSDSSDVAVGDGGWTNCEAPSGVSVCGGPNHCGAQCKTCLDGDGGDLNVCYDNVGFAFDAGPSVVNDPFVCPDGAMDACGDQKDLPDCLSTCVNEDLPKLYLLNGRPDLARYSDRATYNGDPIPPPPTSCPQVASGLQLCGGACGAPCNDSKHVCTGRSPLHPYSMCVPAEPDTFPCARGNAAYCNSIRTGYMCLTYQVDSAAQSIADQNSLCVPSNICQAAAQSYPGGAFCTSGS